ncbi:MAG TPA: response regulator [Bryobacteraceae bacterium]|nr:response regulator [Bryobacteraceae bacterium]
MPVAMKKVPQPEHQYDGGTRERCVTVLAVGEHEDDHAALRNIVSHSNWRLRSARTWSEARASLIENPASVIVCDHRLPDATWRDVLNYVADLPEKPVLIVSSRTADDQLWGEVLNLGAYDLLLKPFDQQEVVRVVSLAWLNWKNACEQARKAAMAGAAPRLMVAGA